MERKAKDITGYDLEPLKSYFISCRFLLVGTARSYMGLGGAKAPEIIALQTSERIIP